MTAPSGRHVLPELTGLTSAGWRTPDPWAKLLEERIVLPGTPVGDTSAEDVVARLVHLEHHSPDRHACLYIDSPGGSFDALAAIHDTMEFLTCDGATTGLGPPVSAPPAADAPGKRSALPGARVVLRQPSPPEPVRGQVSDLAVRARTSCRASGPAWRRCSYGTPDAPRHG